MINNLLNKISYVKKIRFYLFNGVFNLFNIFLSITILIVFGNIINIILSFIIQYITKQNFTINTQYGIIDNLKMIIALTALVYIVFAIISLVVKIDFVKRYCKEHKITKEGFFQKSLKEMYTLWDADWAKDD